MASDYHQMELFGGAITAALPANFLDGSDIRQIPDNQEVFLDKDGFTSIVFDILERVDQPDTEALKTHLKDITEGDGADDVQNLKVWTSGSAVLSKLPPNTPAYTLFASSPPAEKQRGRAHEPDFVAILLCLVRLEKEATDIVVAINVPHVEGQYDKDIIDFGAGRNGVAVEKALQYRQKILETFEIKDWSLFVQE